MAKATTINEITLVLSIDEARKLEGLLINAVSFSDNPELHEVYEALAENTGNDIPEFKYNEDMGFFEEVEE